MDIEEDKVVHTSSKESQKCDSSTQQVFTKELETATTYFMFEQEQNKDFIEHIFNKSNIFRQNMFGSQQESQPNSRKISFEALRKNSCVDDEEFNLFQKFTSDLGNQNIDETQIKQKEIDPIEFVEDSHPLFNHPFQSTNLESDSLMPHSLFYLNDEQMHNPFQSQIYQKRNQYQVTDNDNNYQLQNLTDGKILLKRVNSYNPKSKRKPFSDDEDDMIVEMIKKHGRDFKFIAQHLPGRTEQMVKNRYKSKIRKQFKSSQNLYNDLDQVNKYKSQQSKKSFKTHESQTNSRSQDLSESYSSGIEKLHKIQILQSEIERIEDLLRSTKSEIIKEYLTILQQKTQT